MELLADSRYQHIIKWDENTSVGQFTFIQPEKMAQIWGLRKGRTNMNFDKLSRCLRYYYGQMVLTKVRGLRFSYKFHPSLVPMHNSSYVHKKQKSEVNITRPKQTEVMHKLHSMDTDTKYISFVCNADQDRATQFSEQWVQERLETKRPEHCFRNKNLDLTFLQRLVQMSYVHEQANNI